MDVNQVGAHFYVDVHKMLPEGGEVDKFKFKEEATEGLSITRKTNQQE